MESTEARDAPEKTVDRFQAVIPMGQGRTREIQSTRGPGPDERSPDFTRFEADAGRLRPNDRRAARLAPGSIGTMTFRIAAGTFALLFALLSSLVVQAEDEKVDRILVEKGKRRLFLLDGEDIVRVFWISLGDNPVGHKLQEGDERTPEGTYTIDYRNPDSRFHRSLHISYPNDADRERAEREGVDPGGMIMIHGIGNALGWLRRFHRLMDWTDGCIAVTDAEMDTIWKLVEIGTPIEIVP